MPELTIPDIRLHDGVAIPQVGLGVFQVHPEETQSVVEHALQAGYRHIDAAAPNGSEAVGAALAATDLPREEVFVTAKLWNSQQGYDSTLRAFEATLGRFGLEYVDLHLIHRPLPGESGFIDTWRACERILEEERARTIGVSSFRIEDLEQLEVETDTRPTVHQVEPHLRLHRLQLFNWHTDYGIATEAWGPLAQGDLLDDGAIGEIASHHGKTSAQAILRWHVQLGTIAVFQPVTGERIRESIEIFDFELSDDEMAAIGALLAKDIP